MNREKGVVILFSIFVVLIMLAFGGLAIDGAALLTERSELHRATDAASLAGAGKLGFDSSVFPAVRDFAVNFGANNPNRFGPISLNRNDGNAPNGDVVLGIWDGTSSTFTPSLDGTMVNAVRCRTTRTVPMTFLRMLGLLTFPMSAESIAVSNPPILPPENKCIFPIGVSDCPFKEASTYGSNGCGAVISFINANTNTSGWLNITGTGAPSAVDTRNAVAAAAGGGTCANSPPAGSSRGMQGGMDQSVFDDISRCNPGSGTGCTGYFNSLYSGNYQVKNFDGSVAYSGPGWEVYVPVVYSDGCPPGNINQPHEIATYAKILIVQVINRGWCGVSNHITLVDGSPNPWDNLCPPPNGSSSSPRDSNRRAIFAFYDCGSWASNPTVVPAPRAALGTRLRLVQ